MRDIPEGSIRVNPSVFPSRPGVPRHPRRSRPRWSPCGPRGLRPLLVAALAATVFLGCETGGTGGASDPVPPTFAEDPDAGKLAGIQQRFDGRGALSPDDFDTLRGLGERHPHEPGVRALLERVLLAREDWHALIDLRTLTPPHERTDREWRALATLLVKAQRYDDACRVLDRLVSGHPDDVELRWSRAFADYYRGQYARAVEALDTYETELLAAGHTQTLLFRGLSRFQLDEMDAAVADLEAYVARAPDDIAGLNGLARALVAVGRDDEADPLLARVEALHDRRNTAESQQAYLAAKARGLDEALSAGRFDEAETIILELLPRVEGPFKQQLEAVLRDIRSRAGRAGQGAR